MPVAVDLWGFRDAKELERNTSNMPDSILKEQINMLGEKTGFVLYGRPTVISIRSEEIDYRIATVFDVVVPKLDDYAKTVLIMYSNPESEYPVAITVNSSYEDDCESFSPDYKCNDRESFNKALKSILSSETLLNTIKVLYSKAAVFS